MLGTRFGAVYNKVKLLPGLGKSTLVNLLERFYDPASGTVLVNDLDLRTVPPPPL